MDKVQSKPDFQDLAKDAVEIAKKNNYILDFSNQSIKTLDTYLLRMYSQAQIKEVSEDQYAKMAMIFGAYVGETFIRNTKKGGWVFEPSQKAWAVKVDKSFIFFPAKVYRRLKYGEEESVTQLYVHEYKLYTGKDLDLTTFPV